MGTHGYWHFVNKCQYGYTHGQCRCPSKDKTVKQIMCDNPEHIPEDRDEKVKGAAAVRDDLIRAREKREAADAVSEEAMNDLKTMIVQAYKAGYSKSLIASLAKVSRQTVYATIKEVQG